MRTCKECVHFSKCEKEAIENGGEKNPNYEGEEFCDRFKYYSHGDVMREMSDEQLAAFLAHEAYRMAEPVFRSIGIGITEECLYILRLKWLKQPVEVDDV